jgi:glycosyltransferase involved in cell wall biosynthesis
LYFHVLLPRALRRCDGILTVSETSKKEIVAVYGINPAMIHIVPNAVDLPSQDFYLDANTDEDSPYLLMVGVSWKHKNGLEVLEQHALWRPHFRLKIVAGVGQYSEQLRQRCLALDISDSVEIMQGVTDATLDALYRGCRALVYPSTREGFGLPPLEAMARGKSVIVSDISIFRELFGDVAIFVKLGDSSSWKLAFDNIIKQDGSSERAYAGLKLASSYSKKRMCIALTTALEKIWHVSF